MKQSPLVPLGSPTSLGLKLEVDPYELVQALTPNSASHECRMH